MNDGLACGVCYFQSSHRWILYQFKSQYVCRKRLWRSEMDMKSGSGSRSSPSRRVELAAHEPELTWTDAVVEVVRF